MTTQTIRDVGGPRARWGQWRKLGVLGLALVLPGGLVLLLLLIARSRTRAASVVGTPTSTGYGCASACDRTDLPLAHPASRRATNSVSGVISPRRAYFIWVTRRPGLALSGRRTLANLTPPSAPSSSRRRRYLDAGPGNSPRRRGRGSTADASAAGRRRHGSTRSGRFYASSAHVPATAPETRPLTR